VSRVVVITGASRGIGRATAMAFAATGASLFLTDGGRDLEVCPYPLGTPVQLEETAERCRAAGAEVETALADVRAPEDVQAAAQRLRERFGPAEVLVNNAGIVGPGGKMAHEFTEDEWTTMMEVDLNGVWRWARAVLPDMMQRRAGTIINVSSTAGLVAFPYFANYVAAKHGVVGLTRALALDYASFGIRVNAVCPTSIRDDPREATGMLAGVASMLGLDRGDYEALSLPHHPLGTLVDADDVVSAIVWLASDAAARVTGIALPVDAGFTIR
jgi:NAD(P)-dependent dehydrogenase (short-subunit alcohol dehydrogenase family)